MRIFDCKDCNNSWTVPDDMRPFLCPRCGKRVKERGGKRPSNADRIRDMSDLELADFISNICYPECPMCPAYCCDICEGWSDDCREKMRMWLVDEMVETD